MRFLERLTAWIFQVCMALCHAGKAYAFVHNDLHVENIMMQPTEDTYLSYSFEGRSYRVPTYGYICKIIDYGRAICTYRKKTYMSDVFEPSNEAGKQYIYIDQETNKRKKIDPNPSFDLSRLACSFFEEIESAWLQPHGAILTLMRSWTFDDFANDVSDTEGFELYVQIAQDLHRAEPKDQLARRPFLRYEVVS